MRRTGENRLFYGYWIIAASLLLMFLMSGVGFYSFGIFFKPIQEEFNWSREITSVAFTMLSLVQAASSPFIGRLTERYGPKKVMTVGALTLGSGLGLLSLTTSLPFFYLAYAIAGIGLTAIGMIPVSTVIANWFIKRRGIAIGIAATGFGLGGLVLAPTIGVLIPTFGWRMTYQILALLSLALVTIPTQLVIKTSPKEKGLYPDGIEPSQTEDEKKSSSSPSEGWRLDAALKTSTFWLITSAFVMYGIAHVGTVQHLVNHLTDIGFSVTTATAAVSGVGLGSIVGKFLFGYGSDRLAARYCAALSFLIGIVATLILIIVNSASSTVLILVFAFVMGLCVGGWAPLTSVLIGQNFGLAHYGTIYGVLSLFFGIGTGVGPTLFGYTYDTTHSYYWAFIASLVLYSAAIACILASRRPRLRATPPD